MLVKLFFKMTAREPTRLLLSPARRYIGRVETRCIFVL